jgi:hypothetical protein
MGIERYERWEPVAGVTTPVSRALVEESREGLSVTLVFSEIVDGLSRDLRIAFGRVPAYAVHEEFVHPWNISESEHPPGLAGRWEGVTFPLLLVANSLWLGSFSDGQLLNYPGCVHYRLLTLDRTIDVLSNTAPEAAWVEP